MSNLDSIVSERRKNLKESGKTKVLTTRVVHIIEEKYNDRGLVSITEKTKVNGKMLVENYEMLPPTDHSEESEISSFVYRFDLENGKKMVLDSSYSNDTDGEQLFYVFADKRGRVELFYDGRFDYDASTQTLSFINKPVRYQINQKGIKNGARIHIKSIKKVVEKTI